MNLPNLPKWNLKVSWRIQKGLMWSSVFIPLHTHISVIFRTKRAELRLHIQSGLNLLITKCQIPCFIIRFIFHLDKNSCLFWNMKCGDNLRHFFAISGVLFATRWQHSYSHHLRSGLVLSPKHPSSVSPINLLLNLKCQTGLLPLHSSASLCLFFFNVLLCSRHLRSWM